jgi:hypothetical protein
MKTKTIILIVIILIAIIGGAIYYSQTIEKDMESVMGPTEEQKETEEEGILEILMSDPQTEVINLEPVDQSDSSGKAYRLVKGGKLYHAVVANMPDPSGDNKYEGWLVQPSPLKFFSTGVMEKNEQGSWVLEFEVDGAFSEYYRVVITLETIVDPVPEKHIIEGDFLVK